MKKLVTAFALTIMASASYADYSEGDKVCVSIWEKPGHYCGIVDRVTSESYKIEITDYDSNGYGLRPHDDCTGGKHIGGGMGAKVGDMVWAKKWCVD